MPFPMQQQADRKASPTTKREGEQALDGQPPKKNQAVPTEEELRRDAATMAAGWERPGGLPGVPGCEADASGPGL